MQPRDLSHIPNFPGWKLLGSFPTGDDDGVGSWLLAHGRDAAVLEIPPGLSASEVRRALEASGATLRFATASHSHWDHFDRKAWNSLKREFPEAEFIHPRDVRGERSLDLGGEPVWLVSGPKHSKHDVVTVFRGAAMTGDIELGVLKSVNREVPIRVKRESLRWLAGFCERNGYQVHATVSAHLNDVRQSVDWPSLFAAD